MGTRYAVVNSGQQVSGIIDISKGQLLGISVPVVTSCDLILQGAFSQVSADMVRIQRTQPNTGDLRHAIGPGSNMVLWPSDIPSPPFMRIETSVVQTDVRSFTVVVRGGG